MRLARLLLIPVGSLVAYGLFGPAPAYPELLFPGEVWDRLAHASAAGLLFGLAVLASGLHGRPLVGASLAAIAGGGAVELIQLARPGRSTELADLAADAAGIAAALLVIAAHERLRSRPERSPELTGAARPAKAASTSNRSPEGRPG